MKTVKTKSKIADPVIAEVRAIKREIMTDHEGDLDAFFAGLRKRQAGNPRLVKAAASKPKD